MPGRDSMRDRVQSGNVLTFFFFVVGLLSFWWNSNTAEYSVWWVCSIAVIVVSLFLVVIGVHWILSGFSGFGRNFHEPREAFTPSAEDGPSERLAAINRETAGVLGFPMVLMIFGGLTFLVRLFPQMNIIPESGSETWIPTRFLNPMVFAFGSILIAWSVLLQVMMKTGPDRWDYVPGARAQIRSYTRMFFVLGVLLILFAAWSMA